MPEKETQVYQSTTLGLPALKMVLVHARNEAQNASGRSTVTPPPAPEVEQAGAPLPKEQVVRKIIEHLEGMD